MNIKEVLNKARIEGLKNKDNDLKTSVGYALAEIKQYEVDEQKEANDEVIVGILKRLIRQRKEAIEKFSNVKELVDRDSKEIEILSRFLPVQLTEEEIVNVIDDVFKTLENPDLKTVMIVLKEKFAGKADMKFVSATVKSRLN